MQKIRWVREGGENNVPKKYIFFKWPQRIVSNGPGRRYLIETDPRFVNYDNFISSDFLLDKLGVDPEWTQTRLGDGFYEQRLVLDQITQLTGRRYLGNYADG
ncbi:hypothetical protein AE929_19990, partial [Xanthomonas arboricola]